MATLALFINNLSTSPLFLSNDVIVNESSACPWRDEFRKKEADLIVRWKKSGLFVDEDLDLINCNWFQFPTAPLIQHLVLALFVFFAAVVGMLSNSLVIYLLATSRHLRTPANILIANLAASDFLMLVKMPVFVYNSLLQGPALGSTGCQVYGFLSGLSGCSSIMSLAAVAIERCSVISQPLSEVNRKLSNDCNCLKAYLAIGFIWIYSGTISALPLFGVGNYVPEGYMTSCCFDYLSEDLVTRRFIFAIFVAAWVIPITIIIISYALIVRYVWKAKTDILTQSNMNQESLNDIDQYQQQQNQSNCLRRCINFELPTAKITMGLIVLWFLSWTPYAVMALLGISGQLNYLTPGMTMFPALFAKSSACINPFVYSLTLPKIKKEMARRCQYWVFSRIIRSENSSTISRRHPAAGGSVQHRQQHIRLRRRSHYNHSSEIFTNPIDPDAGRIVCGASHSRSNSRHHSRNQFNSSGNDTTSIHCNGRSVANRRPTEEALSRSSPLMTSRPTVIVDRLHLPLERSQFQRPRRFFDHSRANPHQSLIFYSETSCSSRLDHQRDRPSPFYSMDGGSASNFGTNLVTRTPI